MEVMKKMAGVVDKQNSADKRYEPMFGNFEKSIAFLTACDLVFKGHVQPSGYTEPLLHKRRLEKKLKIHKSFNSIENILIILLLIIFSDFAAINKIIKVTSVAAIKASIPIACLVKSFPVALTETITEVIAAGPASKGVASGKILSLSDVKLVFSSFL